MCKPQGKLYDGSAVVSENENKSAFKQKENPLAKGDDDLNASQQNANPHETLQPNPLHIKDPSFSSVFFFK